ncbi:MAG: ABC transporter ATP-binding protein, partial [Dehalococcoidia bacterium]|nr:ABC transporter ATP-binding protein [Dehalococcoidia bacterium]
DMSARENLHYTAALNGLSRREADRRIDDLLEQVGLPGVAGQRAGSFSRGMRQRLGIADVLIKGPRVVVLDEPTLGIDPDGVRHVLDTIVRMSREQRITVLLSSHLLHQVQQICDRVGIFVKGKLVAVGPIQSLGQQLMDDGLMVVELQADPFTSELEEQVKGLEGVESCQTSGAMVLVNCRQDVRKQIASLVVGNGASLLHLRLRGLALEDIYMKYFGEA